MHIDFPGCYVQWHPEIRQTITYFPDGTSAPAAPHDTPEYHAHAVEKSTGDIDDYCWQHDLAHVIVGLINGRVTSLVLWNIAHGIPTDSPECEAEEREAQEFQKQFFRRPP